MEEYPLNLKSAKLEATKSNNEVKTISYANPSMPYISSRNQGFTAMMYSRREKNYLEERERIKTFVIITEREGYISVLLTDRSM